ncbi:TetR/AcrR family transcriptional regulator [Rhizobium sp. BE258]|uniref:TetR/AcrR family transcriptional regulator n=1 Tax=Rhizobium sp. BE258 TaxID=2817722 RepID=UPI0028615D2C|nr:TetR/AcrR family transcriptional regulator [Rhizobium sp. BE258]MDR7147760.1 AcrR family transcriptional regulator [Rhizobium sp. BE258]
MLIDLAKAKEANATKRNPAQTRMQILTAAMVEFATHGLSGARVDEIAARAETNKRMIYHYFGSKDGLFGAVLEEAYATFQDAQNAAAADTTDPLTSLKKIVEATWAFYRDQPEFIVLMNDENVHRASHLRHCFMLKRRAPKAVALIGDTLARGRELGLFRDIDPEQLSLTIDALCYHYFSNRFTMEVMHDKEFMTDKRLNQRLDEICSTILCVVHIRDGKLSPDEP